MIGQQTAAVVYNAHSEEVLLSETLCSLLSVFNAVMSLVAACAVCDASPVHPGGADQRDAFDIVCICSSSDLLVGIAVRVTVECVSPAKH